MRPRTPIAVAVLAVTSAVVVGCGAPSDTKPPAATTPALAEQTSTMPPPGVPAFDTVTTDRITTALADESSSLVETVVALPAGTRLPQTTIAALRTTLPWEFDYSTVQYLGDAAASAQVRTSGGTAGTWRMVFVLDNGVWKLATTDKPER